MYVIYTITLIGMMYDHHRLAPILEFIRCSLFFFYSRGGIPILSNTLSWSGLTEVLGESMEVQLYFLLRVYFFISTLIWGIISASNSTEFFTVPKLKRN